MTAAAVRLSGIVKRYPNVVAVDGANLSVREGEVHSIVGENGAGKTTLMRILAGVTRPDAGAIEVHRATVTFRSALDAAKAGIGMVHQHYTLVPAFTVLENIRLGRESAGRPALRRRLREISESLGYDVDPEARVEDLSVGERQRVEIVRILLHGARVLILDEPTDVLTPVEARDLLARLRRLAREGHTVLFVSHRLGEVLDVSDRITVMRRGRVVDTVKAKESDERQLARRMVGEEVLGESAPERRACFGRIRLRVVDLRANSDRGRPALDIRELAVREGEIVGIAGVTGNGQRELLETVYGLRRPVAGRIIVDGEDLTGKDVRARLRAGVALVPEDRLENGLVTAFTAEENLALGLIGDPEVNPGILLRPAALRRRAASAMERIGAVPRDPTVPIRAFSGGNQQKIVVARALCRTPRVLLLGEPTRGLDVGAIRTVHDRIRRASDEGSAVLLVSSDLAELLALSDRLLVLRRGTITGEVTPGETTEEELGLMMSGGGA